jgi:hypothetical protein
METVNEALGLLRRQVELEMAMKQPGGACPTPADRGSRRRGLSCARGNARLSQQSRSD